MTESIIELSHFGKRYQSKWAVKDLSFEVKPGEIFALLGPNGAGKTTTLESMEGIRSFDSGSIKVCGMDPLHDARKLSRRVGIQLQTQGLPSAMTVQEAIVFMASYHGSNPDWNLASRLGLKEKLAVPFSALSIGYQRRLMLCLAGAHDPELIFLDEPTAGLDVETRDVLHSLMREWKAGGKTLILATHDMAEAEKLADRALVIIRGRQAACASPRELTAQGNILTKVSLVTKNDSFLANPPQIPLSGTGLVIDRAIHYSTSDPGSCVKHIVDLVQRNDDVLEDLRVERPSLEERFLELVKEAV